MYGIERGQVLLHQNGWVYWDGKIFNANDKTLEIVEGYKEYDVAQTLEEPARWKMRAIAKYRLKYKKSDESVSFINGAIFSNEEIKELLLVFSTLAFFSSISIFMLSLLKYSFISYRILTAIVESLMLESIRE